MRHRIQINYNSRTRVLSIYDDATDHFNMMQGDEAESFFDDIQKKLRDKPWQRPGSSKPTLEVCSADGEKSNRPHQVQEATT